MKNKKVPCALRTHRRIWGLSQQELAGLLGFESPTHISRLEQGKRVPGIETALACSTLFGVSLSELFPQLAADIDAHLKKRASELHEGLLHTTNPIGLRKRELLSQALAVANDEVHLALV